jgi:hypothetical protein
MTTFEQMKAAVDAATRGEFATYGSAEIVAGEDETSIAQMLCYADGRHEKDAAAIVAALNWLRGGGIARFKQMREAGKALVEYLDSDINVSVDICSPHIVALKAALAATKEAK